MKGNASSDFLHDPRQENGLRVQEKYRALSIAEIGKCP